MGQKIHPLGLRIGITQNHRSRWFARANKTYWRWLLQDKMIRDYLYKEFKDAKIGDIIISRYQPDLDRTTFEPIEILEVRIWAAALKKICDTSNYKKYKADLLILSKKLSSLGANKQLPEFRIFPRLCQIENSQYQAYSIATELIKQLEDRIPFRRALKNTLRTIKNKDTKKLEVLEGVRIQLSGRLNGAEIARIEWFKEGRVPLHTLRADIDYVSKIAKTTHGILGIKVWTFRGEK